jgi:zinc/manganese transport system substrate-binding protein
MVLVALGAGLAGGCAAEPSADVIAGDGVLCDISRRLAAGRLRVSCLLGPDDDPHQFQLSPRQSRELRQARLVLINGYGLTPALTRLPGAVPVAELAVPDSPRLGQPSTGHEHHDAAPPGQDHQHQHRHQSGERDPHVWHDPRQAAALVRVVSARLQRLEPAPERKAALRRRESELLAALTGLHRWNHQQFASLPAQPGRRTLATGHRAFTSLSRAYGLVERPVVDGLSSSETLRPRELKLAVQQLKNERVPVLFSEQWPPARALRRISELSGVPLAPQALRADGLAAGPERPPLAGLTRSGPDHGDLMATLTANTCLIVDHLGGRCDQPGRQALIARWQAIR